MCKAYEKTASVLDNLIKYRIIRKGREMSYDEIINALKEMGREESALRYNATSSIKDRLEHLRAVGTLDYDYNEKKYKANKKIRRVVGRRKRNTHGSTKSLNTYPKQYFAQV